MNINDLFKTKIPNDNFKNSTEEQILNIARKEIKLSRKSKINNTKKALAKQLHGF